MVLNNKLLLPVALGLSLVTVTAVVVYYVFKKEEENQNNERSQTQIKTSRINIIEVQVPKSIVPAVIGRSGSNLKDIEKKSGANIHFKKFSDKDYDVCIIRGKVETTQLAETLVHEFIKNQPLIVEDTLLVPSWSCGRIIGSGGENINVISHRSGARIKINAQSHSDSTGDRQVNFRGTREQIHTAKVLVQNCVNQEKCRREIEQSKRSPRHVPPPLADEQTHMPGDTSQPAPPRHAARRPDTVGAAIEVYVSAVSSPSRFWVQFVGAQVAKLDDLAQDMTDYYSNKDNRETHALSSVVPGQVVAAVFRHDGRWYRARVDDVRPSQYDPAQLVADVFYLDYGDSEYVAVHELCELRSDLLRLRFQAMECYLAGVKPRNEQATTTEDAQQLPTEGAKWDKWHPDAINLFEELTQVARWKPVVSKTCTYKNEIPGIKLYAITEDGEVDIAAALIDGGWAEEVGLAAPSPLPPAPSTPFGDLGNSRVLGMLAGERGERSTSMPRDNTEHNSTEGQTIPTSSSLASGLEKANKQTTYMDPINMTYPTVEQDKPRIMNGSHETFLNAERQHVDQHSASNETLVPNSSPELTRSSREQMKANMNRIDSHHNNLADLGRSHHEQN